MPVELQELWETAVQFCVVNVIWVLTAAGGLLLLVIVLCVARGGGQRRREADAWMEGFEARMEAFEKNEDPMMPVRKPILTALRESVQDVPQEQKQQTAAVFLSQPAVAKKTVHGILRVLYMKRSTVADFMHRQPAVARRDEAGRLRFHGTHALSYSAGKEVIIRFVSFVLVLAHVDAVFLYESRNGKF